MLNLFVEFGIQPFDMKILPNFKLREGLSLINNFKTGGIILIYNAEHWTSDESYNVTKWSKTKFKRDCRDYVKEIWQLLLEKLCRIYLGGGWGGYSL